MTTPSPDISLPRGVSDFMPEAAARIGYIEGLFFDDCREL